MARYDVYRVENNSALAIDIQANSMDLIDTRVIVPLMPIVLAPPIVRRLNPVFEIGSEAYVFVVQYIATVPLNVLGRPVTSLKSESDSIQSALDMLFQGF